MGLSLCYCHCVAISMWLGYPHCFCFHAGSYAVLVFLLFSALLFLVQLNNMGIVKWMADVVGKSLAGSGSNWVPTFAKLQV